MIGKTVLMSVAMAVVLLTSGGVAGSQDGAQQFPNGCVVREWETDATPSYRVTNPGECARLDQKIDRGDGPSRGRVRSDFRGDTKPSTPRRGNRGGR